MLYVTNRCLRFLSILGRFNGNPKLLKMTFLITNRGKKLLETSFGVCESKRRLTVIQCYRGTVTEVSLRL